MGLADLKRVTDLFVEGEEVVFRDAVEGDAVEGGEPVLLWVNKLNAFEADEARRDGLAARSRVVLALKEIGTPDYDIFQGTLSEMSKDALVEALADGRSQDRLIETVDELRRDETWGPKIEAATRISEDMDEAEKAAIDKINADYGRELSVRMDAKRAQTVADFQRQSREELVEEYRSSYIENRGFTAFQREFVKSQVFFSVRACQATVKLPTGAWDHRPCNGHRQRAFDHRDEVTHLDSALLERLQDAVRSVTIERRDARFSDALTSSSASSVQPSAEVASTPSTPAATSRELATTSS